MDVTVFRISGSFAYWKKGFTSGGSPLTFCFPPRTALIGLIGAVLGVERSKLASKFQFQKTKTAVIPLSPIIKDHLPQTWRQGPPTMVRNKIIPAKFKESFQANVEVVRNPQFEVVFNHYDTKLMDELNERLQEKRWFFTPYLGSLGLLADIDFVGEDTAHKADAKELLLDSVLPLTEGQAKSLRLSEDSEYIREEGIPLEVKSGRSFSYLDIAYVQKSAKPLRVISRGQETIKFFKLERRKKNVIFFEPCTS